MSKEDKQRKEAEAMRRWRTGQLNKNERKAMEHVGLDTADYGWNRPGQYSDKGDYNDMREDFLKEARNNYDYRRSMEAMAMSGKKKAEKIAEKGFRSTSDVMNAQNMMRKAHERNNNGGDFSSASDYAGVTYNSVQRDRKKQTQAYDEQYAKTTDLNDLKDKLMAEATENAAGNNPIEPSDRMAGVEERLEGAASNTPPSLHDKNNADPAKADDQADAARNFLDDYKIDVRKGANIKQDISTSIGNAAKHVTDVYAGSVAFCSFRKRQARSMTGFFNAD